MEGGLPCLHFCGDFVVRRNWKLNERILEEHELVYFPIGTGTVYRCEDQIYTLNEPCWIVTRAGTRHSYVFRVRCTGVKIKFIH
ncbi:hypothetical protein [Gordoniibacillus kamchatkensis]|uniref:hypothetical protein n=1 Tax=Gordoniibacillus kamchatkensis TaxID=1590651 RepID=UPI0012DFEDAE|nr:hypothetical protein [Paenibacillus sp. VKM B-2647]